MARRERMARRGRRGWPGRGRDKGREARTRKGGRGQGVWKDSDALRHQSTMIEYNRPKTAIIHDLPLPRRRRWRRRFSWGASPPSCLRFELCKESPLCQPRPKNSELRVAISLCPSTKRLRQRLIGKWERLNSEHTDNYISPVRTTHPDKWSKKFFH